MEACPFAARLQETLKDDGSSPASYCPVSLTCGKILEHVVHSAVTSHLNQNNILVDAQRSFSKQRLCETQVMRTIDDLVAELDEGGQTDTVLLDFSKGFDKVPHQQLLLKLHHYSIWGQVLCWVGSILTDRT